VPGLVLVVLVLVLPTPVALGTVVVSAACPM